MVIVSGRVKVRRDALAEALAISLEHVKRSRAEPGCISHAVHRDVEDEHRLVFLERWEDRAAIERHFAVPASGEFARALTALAAEPPEILLYEAFEM